ncbi:hypothetical protein JX265_013821 [Neoarthrinium moseri]|uniref:Uncharacterized protein n=1 Tax=Neoarthrinium moseri TaxID=1658444 RepID=A0A9P9W7V0_9PEZI|nr:hypothetical protein JX265_013821 [Neoarthrinium moseri]
MDEFVVDVDWVAVVPVVPGATDEVEDSVVDMDSVVDVDCEELVAIVGGATDEVEDTDSVAVVTIVLGSSSEVGEFVVVVVLILPDDIVKVPYGVCPIILPAGK